ncbi:MAG: SDR family oxidoreductase [Xanthobacteraceae bacterium]|jgi:NAD(P)-dependent dehydrogenase (short-subunit alcohol dehydrogenase family)
MPRLNGKVAIVTGAAAGQKAALGSVFARALAAEGAKVVVADVKDCSPVAAEIAANGGTAHPVIADVRDPGSVTATVAETVKIFGRLDILVNNAAIGSNIPPVAIEDIDVALWDDFMAVNVRGTFLCTKAAIPAMRRNSYGKIVNLSSTTMVSGLSHRLHYVTSKGAITAMTRSMARELGAYGIRVNSLAPGLVMNDSVAAAMAGRPGLHDFVLSTRAIKKDVFADDLVGALIYLASPESDAVTGQFLIIDNGGDYT